MLQLKKSVSLDCFGQPFKVAIVTAARLGVDAVEVNGRTEVRAEDMSRTAIRHIRKLLSDLGMRISAIHFPTRLGYGDLELLDRRIEATKATLTLAYELGCNVVVNRIGKVPDDPQDPRWNTLVEALMDIGNHSQKAGAWLAARTGAEDCHRLKGLIDRLPPQHLGVDFDPAELVINGHSPSESIQVLAEHVLSFRARDAVTDLSLGRGVEVQFGRGSVDWPLLLGVLEDQNYAGYLTVERDAGNQSIAQCAQAIEYLDNLFR